MSGMVAVILFYSFPRVTDSTELMFGNVAVHRTGGVAGERIRPVFVLELFTRVLDKPQLFTYAYFVTHVQG